MKDRRRNWVWVVYAVWVFALLTPWTIFWIDPLLSLASLWFSSDRIYPRVTSYPLMPTPLFVYLYGGTIETSISLDAQLLFQSNSKVLATRQSIPSLHPVCTTEFFANRGKEETASSGWGLYKLGASARELISWLGEKKRRKIHSSKRKATTNSLLTSSAFQRNRKLFVTSNFTLNLYF